MKKGNPRSDRERLTARQGEALALVASGMTQMDIAKKWGTSAANVNQALATARRKAGIDRVLFTQRERISKKGAPLAVDNILELLKAEDSEGKKIDVPATVRAQVSLEVLKGTQVLVTKQETETRTHNIEEKRINANMKLQIATQFGLSQGALPGPQQEPAQIIDAEVIEITPLSELDPENTEKP